MSLKTLSAGLCAALIALAPTAQAWAGAVRLAVAGPKEGGAIVLLDVGSRRNAEAGRVEADALLVFPKADAGFKVAPADGQEPVKLPDRGRITLQFDCKARSITLIRLTLVGDDGQTLKATEPAPDPQAPVDPTDAHLLAFACGETFPDPEKTYADEASAIAAVRAQP